MSEYMYQYYNAEERKREKAESERPVCDWCGEPIMEDYAFRIDGKLVCWGCLYDTREYIDG